MHKKLWSDNIKLPKDIPSPEGTAGTLKLFLLKPKLPLSSNETMGNTSIPVNYITFIHMNSHKLWNV